MGLFQPADTASKKSQLASGGLTVVHRDIEEQLGNPKLVCDLSQLFPLSISFANNCANTNLGRYGIDDQSVSQP